MKERRREGEEGGEEDSGGGEGSERLSRESGAKCKLFHSSQLFLNIEDNKAASKRITGFISSVQSDGLMAAH